MEAKDTVLPVGRHNESVYCPHCGEEFGIESKVGYERELQAEISFKAGIREVVDYFFYEVGIVRLMGCATMEECISQLPNWQAKLKEWGIEELCHSPYSLTRGVPSFARGAMSFPQKDWYKEHAEEMQAGIE